MKRHRASIALLIAVLANLIIVGTASAKCASTLRPPPTSIEPSVDHPMFSSELILDGIVLHREPTGKEATDPETRHAIMRVHDVWKGEAGPFLTLRFYDPPPECESLPEMGKMLRVTCDAGVDGVVDFRSCYSRPIKMLRRFDPLLAAYRAETAQRALKAETGGPVAQLAFAAYLSDHREYHRALGIYRSLVEHDPQNVDALLGTAEVSILMNQTNAAHEAFERAREAMSDEPGFRRKIVRAELSLFGKFDVAWKDWSDIEIVGKCEAKWLDFTDASFDCVRLRECQFIRATLKNVTFEGAALDSSVAMTGALITNVDFSTTELNGVSFNNVELTNVVMAPRGYAGLHYALMNNVDGSRLVQLDLDLSEAELHDTSFSGARLDRLDATHTLFDHVSLANTALNGAKFAGADLTTADLRGADLLAATFDCATKFPTEFDPRSVGMINTEENCQELP